MFRIVLATSAASATAGGSLQLTWEDCGDASTHSKTKDVQPGTLTLGEFTDVVGSGTFDKKVTGGTVDIHLKAGFGVVDKHFTADNCAAQEFGLPLGLGKLTWGGFKCPVAAGGTQLHIGTQLSAIIPGWAATSDVSMTAVDQDGEANLCVNLHFEQLSIQDSSIVA